MRHIIGICVLLASVPAVAQPAISLTQPGGAGTIQYDVSGAAPNAELYTLVNFTQQSPTGSGPIFGLGLAGSEVRLSQILLPIGTDPHHVYASAAGTYLWTLGAPVAGVSFDIDVVCIEWDPLLGYVDHSSVLATTISL